MKESSLSGKPMRCSIYTRVSTDAGLAQREAAEAYIKANRMRAGGYIPTITTTAVFPAARWNALPCRNYWRI